MLQNQLFQEIPFSSIDENILIGHAHNATHTSGCTVIMSSDGEGFLAGVDCRGGATCSRETDLLKPGMLVEKIHACVLSGGSVFGLDCSSGVTRYLCENQVGYHTDVINVPIVCQAALYDLPMFLQDEIDTIPSQQQPNSGSNKGKFHLLPNYYEMGYQACCNARLSIQENARQFNSDNIDHHIEMNGNIGAGAGASVGKIHGTQTSMKGGLGTFAIQVGDLKIGALVAVNCFGDVIENGNIIAGCLKKNIQKKDPEVDDLKTCCESNADKFSTIFADTEMVLIEEYLKRKHDLNGFVLKDCDGNDHKQFMNSSSQHAKELQRACTNTTLGVVVIGRNAKFEKSQLSRIAAMAHDGFARSMKPSHTLFDGDSIFVLSTHRDDSQETTTTTTTNTPSNIDKKEYQAPTNLVGSLAAYVVEKAVIRGVKSARSKGGYLAHCDLQFHNKHN
nr:unnamed protein product [Naegleria fowleri]